MADFAPRSLGMGHLVVGIGLFIVAAVFGLGWIEGRFTNHQDRERSEKGYRYLLAGVNDKIARVEDQVEAAEMVSRQLGQKFERREAERKLSKEAGVVASEVARLRSLVGSLDGRLEAITEERRSYRDEVRRRLWRSMVGRRLRAEDLLRELPHENMVISRVDPAGLMVRHRTGAARVLVGELTPAFREKLDLHRDEGIRVLREILARDSRVGRSDRAGAQPPAKGPVVSEKGVLLLKIQARILELEALIRETGRQAAVARRNDLRSKTRSAPGSLETWRERARRLEGQLLALQNERAEVQMAVQKLMSK